MHALPHISESEFEVMKVVWKFTPINTNEITERLLKTTSWSAKTIRRIDLRETGARICLYPSGRRK